MWRKLRNLAYSRHLINDVEFHSSIGSSIRTRYSGWKRCTGEVTFVSWKNHEIPRPLIAGFDFCMKRRYAVAAEMMNCTETEEDTEVEGEEKRELGKVELSRYFFRDLKRESEMSKEKYLILRKRQIKMETEAWEQAAKEYQELLADMCEQKLAPNLPYMKSLLLGWFEPFRDAISEDQKVCQQKMKFVKSHGPFFNDLPADMMAVITMHKLMGMLMTKEGTCGVRVVQAASAVGGVIEHEARIFKLFEMAKKARKTPGEESITFSHEKEKLRRKVSNLIRKRHIHQVKHIVNTQDDSKPWGHEIQAKVGCRLIQLLMETAYVQSPSAQLGDAPPDIRPAFVHSIKMTKKEATNMPRRYGVIECDPLIRKGMEKTARYMVIPYMPMLIPPLKWSRYNKGAHLFLPSYIMRSHGSRIQHVKKVPAAQLKPVFEALDTLGGTKWRVNKPVLSIVDRIWACDGCLAGMISRKDLTLPEKPDTEDESEITKWKWRVRDVKKENREMNSLRCETELKLAVAQKMKDEDGFFYPHNLDFRGRAYPMHPHLNHLGSDLCRGILQFAQGRPLGKAGLKWLKIHLANLFAGGVDKLPFSDRISFTENHMDDIFDSAERPLEGRRWWLNAEDPFQCLAACINIYEAIRSSSPEAYISHMPVHQDGSCNGLQHYAALGRDKLGAAAVNLVSSEQPSDVYSGIAARVLEIMKRDAKRDPDTCRDAFYAKLLVGQVDRKLVKQTVMTSVYGVTFVGAREQITKKLKERGVIPDGKELFAASSYATKTTLMALGEMFEAARSIMTWLGDCAKIIAGNNQPVQWATPIGLPVVQPYRKLAIYTVRTSLQMLTLHRETNMVMGRRQKSAFPPNFVHSLDGSHMMMTAVACREAGLKFAGVHDSYWTHACDVEEMNRILREKFVELYEMPILENLLESFKKSFPKMEFPPLPERGDFDLREVLESPYFFN